MTQRSARLTLADLLLVGACDLSPSPHAGNTDARFDSFAPGACMRDTECEDGYFRSTHRCVPGDPSADPGGCVASHPPCDQELDECRQTENFGGGQVSSPNSAGFLTIDELLNLRAHRVLSYPGAPVNTRAECSASVLGIATGPADTAAVVGGFTGHAQLRPLIRSNVGLQDGFFYRFAN